VSFHPPNPAESTSPETLAEPEAEQAAAPQEPDTEVAAKPTKNSLLQRFVASAFFSVFCNIVVVANLLYTGFNTQQNMERALEKLDSGVTSDPGMTPIAVELSFYSFYVIELVLKIWCWRMGFFQGEEGRWNFFDLLLVFAGVISFAELIDGLFSGSNLVWMRIARMLRQVLRAVRVLRVVRHFQEFRILMVAIGSSMPTFFWAMLMLALNMYIWALVFVDGLAQYILDTSLDSISSETRNAARDKWASMTEGMLTEFKAVTGGNPWSHTAEGVRGAGEVYYVLFIIYIAFLVIAVLKLLTGIFVQRAAAAALEDRNKVIHSRITELFAKIDSDGNGYISKDEFLGQATAYMGQLHISTKDLKKLFQMMDRNADDHVDMAEFIETCQRYKEWTRCIDLYVATERMDKMCSHITEFMEYVDQCFSAHFGDGGVPCEDLRSRLVRVNTKHSVAQRDQLARQQLPWNAE